jgi:periplasmic protein CpxP/Spy
MKNAPNLLTFGSVALVATLLVAGQARAQTTEAPTHPTQTPAAETAPQTSKHVTSKRAPTRPTDYETALDNRIASMHQTLEITPSQEGAWSAFAQVMHDNASAVADAYKARSSTIKTMNASQNLQNYVQIEQQRAQGVQKLSIAFDTLYGQLSDNQKVAADQMFRRYQLRARGAHRPDAATPAPKAPAAKSP